MQEKRIDPADEKPYTYKELVAWYAGKYSIDVIRTYWLYECHCISHVSTQRTLLSLTDRLQDGAKERRPDDVALWNQLEFQDGRLVRFPSGMSWGLIHALQQPRDLKYFDFILTGHTDNVGNEEYNKQLSRNRCRSVKDFLLNQGIRSNQLFYKAESFESPAVSNETYEGKAKNRRVELRFKK